MHSELFEVAWGESDPGFVSSVDSGAVIERRTIQIDFAACSHFTAPQVRGSDAIRDIPINRYGYRNVVRSNCCLAAADAARRQSVLVAEGRDTAANEQLTRARITFDDFHIVARALFIFDKARRLQQKAGPNLKGLCVGVLDFASIHLHVV